MFRETGAAVAADGARKAWYFSSGVLVLALAVALAMFCVYMVISLGSDLLAMRRDLVNFPRSAWVAVVIKVPLALASFWLARKFALQTFRLWNVASSPMEDDAVVVAENVSGIERARQAAAVRLGVAAKAANDGSRRAAPVAAVKGPVASPAKRMGELKECLEAGVITPAEFEAKRAEILRNL